MNALGHTTLRAHTYMKVSSRNLPAIRGSIKRNTERMYGEGSMICKPAMTWRLS